jgi:hypothetical protein
MNAWIVVETRSNADAVWTYFDRLGGRGNGPGSFSGSDRWQDSLRTPAAIESRLLVCADGYATAIRPFRVAPEETIDLGDVVLDPGAEFEGRVEDEAGRAVVGARVDGGVPLLGFFCPGDRWAETDVRGAFRIGHLAAGEQILLVSGREFATTYVQTVVGGAAPVVRVGRGHSVRVTVTDAAGNPKVGVSIDVRPASADDSGVRFARGTTDATGGCELRVGAGRWRFFAEHADVVVDVDEGRHAEARLVLK